MLVEGRLIQMIIMLVSILLTIYFTNEIRGGKKITLRSIAGLDAIDEIVSRAAEMGRPVHFCPGYTKGGLHHPSHGPQVLAGLTILKVVARSAAMRGTPIIVTLQQPEAIPIAEEIIKNAYAAERQELRGDEVRFVANEQFAYASAVMRILRDERPAASFLLGCFWAEAAMLAEEGNNVGAMQLTGSASVNQLPFLLAASDYTLIGEELFAAEIIINRDTNKLGSLVSQDFSRGIIISIILLLFIGSNLSLPWLVQMLQM